MGWLPNQVKVKILDPRAAAPTRGTQMSAGYDLIACIDKPMSIRAGEKAALIPTGLAMFIDDENIAGLILPRSGLGHKQGLVLGNTLGLVDGDYQNQWFVSVTNRGQQDEIIINPGDRIAQAVFIPVIHPDFIVVEDFEEKTERGQGGFGSTGVAAAADNVVSMTRTEVADAAATRQGVRLIKNNVEVIFDGKSVITTEGAEAMLRGNEIMSELPWVKADSETFTYEPAVPRGSLGEEIIS